MSEVMMQPRRELPPFYVTRTLLSFHPAPDLNQVTLHGPDGFAFVMYQMGEERAGTANQMAVALAAALSELWKEQKTSTD